MPLMKDIKKINDNISKVHNMNVSLSYLFYLTIIDLRNQVSIDLNPEILDFLDKFEKEVLPLIIKEGGSG